VGLHVNVSPRELQRPELIRRVSDALETTGLSPSQLVLEITESGLMRDPRAVLGRLEALRDLGVRLAIDDFGTGHASLTQLKTIPADELKLDRSFIIDLAEDRRERALVRAAIEMAHALELQVVAEGVETEAQLDILRELGCDTVQGYYLARPAPAHLVQLQLPASA
jgi:EAL domain-containing protein (putative c-di-GMP-specific phosphodiesterase class I)